MTPRPVTPISHVAHAGLVLLPSAGSARADDDGGEGGGGSSGSGGGGSGSGGSGSGGKDGNDDDGGEHDSESEDDDGDNDSEIGETGSNQAREAQKAVVEGKAKPLTDLLTFLNDNYPGQILDVDLKRSNGIFEYRLKILQDTGKVIKLRLDAMTLALR